MQICDDLLTINPELVTGITKSISDAVGDDIKLDVKINELDTNNGTPTRIWDYINRNLSRNLPHDRYITKITKRGRWELKPIFDKEVGVLYTIMREERFAQLQNEVIDRDSAHYVQALSHELNSELEYQQKQLTLFNIEEANYFDEEQIQKILQKIYRDLGIPDGVVNNHVVILFSSKNYTLLSVRACVLKGDLSIVGEKEWNEFIDITESSIVETTNEIESIVPEDKLRFKAKATKKLEEKKKIKAKDKNIIEEHKNEIL